jgi:hypothetical protein
LALSAYVYISLCWRVVHIFFLDADSEKPLGMEYLNMVISVTEKFLKEISEHSLKEGAGR